MFRKFTIIATLVIAFVFSVSSQSLTEEAAAERARQMQEFKTFVKSLDVEIQIAVWEEHISEQLKNSSWTSAQRKAIIAFKKATLTPEFFALEQTKRSEQLKELRKNLSDYLSGLQIVQVFELLCPYHVEKYKKSGQDFFNSRPFMNVRYTSATFNKFVEPKTCRAQPSADPSAPCRTVCTCSSTIYCAIAYGDDFWCKRPVQL